MSENRDAFKVNSLSDLDRASPVEGEVVWDSVRSIWNSAIFSAAVIFGPLTFGWSALLVFILTAGITPAATNTTSPTCNRSSRWSKAPAASTSGRAAMPRPGTITGGSRNG